MTKPNSNRPVFIVGVPRTGTSLMYRTILLHSDFFPGGLVVPETNIFRRSTQAWELTKKIDDRMYNYMLSNDIQYRHFINSIRYIALVQRALRPLTSNPTSTSIWRLVGGDSVVRSFFKHAQKARNGARIVEKTPYHVRHIDRIFTTYPSALVLLMVRHPIHTYSSFRRRQKTEEQLPNGNPDWLRITPEEFTHLYRRGVEEGLKGKEKYNNQVSIIRYEDFVSNPAQVFEDICFLLGIDFERAPIEGKCSGLRTHKYDPHLSRPITRKTKNWRDFVTVHEARQIESNLTDLLNRFTYNQEADE